MKNTGAELKKAREQQNLSLTEVSMSTKINARVLEAMEENLKEKLPAKPFLRGFVKTYAEFLKLDSNEILKMFEEDLNPKPKVVEPPVEQIPQKKVEVEEKTSVPKKKKPEAKKSFAPKAASLKLPFLKEATITKQIFLVVFLVLLIFMTIFVKDLVEKYQSEKEKAITSPVQKQLEPIPDTKEQPSKDDTKKALPAGGVENQKQSPEPKKATTTTESKKEIIKNETKPKATEEKIKPQKEEEPSTTEEKKTETKKKESPEKPEKPKQDEKTQTSVAKQEVILEAMDAVNVTAIIDGKKEVSIKLAPGKVHVFKGNTLKIKFSDAGSVNVISNGRYLGVPGDLGQSKTVTYP